MTNITPQQMRELADAHWMPIPHEQTVAAALRTAADQLEAVRAAVDEVGDMLDGRGRYLSEVLRDLLGMER